MRIVKQTLRNAIVVSLQDAQNQRGFSNHHGQITPRTQTPGKKKTCISPNVISSFTHRCKLNQTNWKLTSMPSGTLSLSHCKMLRISGESVSNHREHITSRTQTPSKQKYRISSYFTKFQKHSNCHRLMHKVVQTQLQKS